MAIPKNSWLKGSANSRNERRVALIDPPAQSWTGEKRIRGGGQLSCQKAFQVGSVGEVHYYYSDRNAVIGVSILKVIPNRAFLKNVESRKTR